MSNRTQTAAGDWRQIKDDREKYKAYLCSREWALLRNAVRARCGGKCERCGVNDMECVHHLTYARKYDEPIEDLAGWCNACHEFTHGKSDYDPAQKLVPSLELLTLMAQREVDGGREWVDVCGSLLFGLKLLDTMGKAWFMRAAEGGFKPDHESIDLAELIRKRRQEQGIQ